MTHAQAAPFFAHAARAVGDFENGHGQCHHLHHHRVALHRGANAQTPDVEANAESIDADGVHLSGVGQVNLGRYVWMDLDVDEGEPVRALGEVQPRDPLTLALDIKFKHLFPDHKRRLMRALGK